MIQYLHTIRQRATHMFLTVTRIMLPVMVLVYMADRIGLVRLAGRALAPAMALFGLPPQAGIIWATAILTNLYGGIATLAALSDGLHMNVAQVSVLGAMILFAHNVPTEQSIARRAGASALVTGALRLGVAVIFGAAANWICQTMQWLQEPVSFTWLSQGGAASESPQALWPWLLSTAESLLLILVVIIGLIILLDVLERFRITPMITRLLTPILKLSGLEERAAPLTTIGVLLGLAYGGALIIDAAQRQHFSARTRLLALSWLSLYHSIIEDTVLIMALGADLWIILVARSVVTLAALTALAYLTRPQTRWGRRLGV